VRAGRAVRSYRVVKADGTDDLVFQSVQDGRPIRDNNILVRFIKPAARALGIPWVNWRCLRTPHATWMVDNRVLSRKCSVHRHLQVAAVIDSLPLRQSL